MEGCHAGIGRIWGILQPADPSQACLSRVGLGSENLSCDGEAWIMATYVHLTLRGDCPPILGDDSADLGLSLERPMVGDDDMAQRGKEYTCKLGSGIVSSHGDDFKPRCGAGPGAVKTS